MVKRIIVYILIVLLAFTLFYFGHAYFLGHNVLSYDLLSVYLFHVLASILVYIILELVAAKLPNQAGYAYLASIFVKLGFFVLIFKSAIFGNESLEMYERISLIVPLFLFLIIEALSVAKILNSK